MSDRFSYEAQRIRRMPEMIEATERKLLGLYREAKRYGMDELLESKWAFDQAWDREIQIAKTEAEYLGREHSMGDAA